MGFFGSEPQHAVVSASTSGNNTLVAAVTGSKIRVIALFLSSSGGANDIRFESGAGGTALTGVVALGADDQFILPANTAGWFETDAGDLLNLELSAANAVGGALVYVEVD